MAIRDSSVTQENKLLSLNFILLNTANVLYIFCFGVRDVLWLRILAVAAMFLLLPFYALQPVPMTDCIVWQMVFIVINVYWIVIIVRERRPPSMTEEEQLLYNNVFKGCCSPKGMLRLIEQSEWNQAEFGTKLIARKADLDQLLLIQSGNVSVQVKGKEVTVLNAGNLVGEMSFLTKGKTVADVIATGPVRYLSWRRDVLEKLFETKAELKSAIHEIIGRDLVQKMTAQDPRLDLTESIFI